VMFLNLSFMFIINLQSIPDTTDSHNSFWQPDDVGATVDDGTMVLDFRSYLPYLIIVYCMYFDVKSTKFMWLMYPCKYMDITTVCGSMHVYEYCIIHL